MGERGWGQLVNRLDLAAVLSWFLVLIGLALVAGGVGVRVWGADVDVGPQPGVRFVVELAAFSSLLVLPPLVLAVVWVVAEWLRVRWRAGAAGLVPAPVLVWAALATMMFVGFVRTCAEGQNLDEVGSADARFGTVVVVTGALIVAWAGTGVRVFSVLGNAARREAGYRTRGQPEGSPALGWPASAPSRWRFVPLVLAGLLVAYVVMVTFIVLAFMTGALPALLWGGDTGA